MANLDSALIFTYISNLEKENQQLKDRINKAIEYIEKHRKTFSLGINEEIDEFDYISTRPKKLLKILKEDNKEE